MLSSRFGNTAIQRRKSMGVKLYQKCIIVPFSYDAGNYEKLENENQFGEIYIRKEFRSSAYNSLGKKLLTEEGRTEKNLVLQRYQLSDKGRKACNLHHNKQYRYQWKTGKNNGSFQIGDIEAWFFRSGIAFLTIQMKSCFEDIERALEFHAMYLFSSNLVFQWIKKQYKDGTSTDSYVKLSLKQLVDNCLGFLECSSLKRIKEDIYHLTFMLTEDSQETASKERLQKFCLQKKLKSGNVNLGSEVSFYEYCDYIQWAVSKDSVVVWADSYIAGENNRTFVETGFPYSVFHNYLALYLYYLTKLIKCMKLEQIIDKISLGDVCKITFEEQKQFRETDTEIRPMAEGKYVQLDILFRSMLCEEQWNLSQRFKKIEEQYQQRILKKKKYDVFISYRHDGGQYLALLLFNYLSKKGISVFWDKDSLRAGHYEEQIYEVMRECENVLVILSENCIERLQEEDDWVRKELAYAFKIKSKVLMVSMEGVEFPKHADHMKLPEEIKQLPDCHGIDTNVALFDGVIDRIIKAIDII